MVVVLAVGAMGVGVADAAPAPTQYFTIISVNDEPSVIVTAGPISATGKNVELNRRTNRFVFPRGSLKVKHTPITSKETFDRTTCVATFSETGTYTVTGGTRAYAHASGSGRYTSFGFIQGCDPNEPPTSFFFIVSGHGPLTLD